jgi:hypothetical protein
LIQNNGFNLAPILSDKYGMNAEAAARRTPRRMFQHPIGVMYHGKYAVLEAHQLSEGGLLFSSPEPLTVHDFILATLIMPCGQHVIIRGELVYEIKAGRGPFKYGVKFAELPLAQRRAIRNYVGAKTRAEAEAEAKAEA